MLYSLPLSDSRLQEHPDLLVLQTLSSPTSRAAFTQGRTRYTYTYSISSAALPHRLTSLPVAPSEPGH